MGRRAKPVELHVLNGNKANLSKKQIREREAGERKLRPPSDRVRPPTWLDKRAKAQFRRIVKDLDAADLLTNVDVPSLAVYCDALIKHADASEEIDEDGITITGAQGNPIQNPAVLVASKYAGIIAKYASRFGLDPSARASLAIPGERDDEPKDPFEERFGS